MHPVRIGTLSLDDNSPPLLIAGPCVIEGEDETLDLAGRIAGLGVVREHFQFVFKASYSKDNRSSGKSFRGPGIDEGLRILQRVRDTVGCPILSDVHSPDEARKAGAVLDVLQIPAFLSRQTSLLEAAGATGRAVNIKKGQFLAPEGAGLAADKARNAGARDILLTERGTTFGYNDLIVDFRAIERMKRTGWPVVIDVTHSLQRPGGLGDRSGGEPELAGVIARAAAAVPCDGFFIETHPDPPSAKSDAASMLRLADLAPLLEQVYMVHSAARGALRGTQ